MVEEHGHRADSPLQSPDVQAARHDRNALAARLADVAVGLLHQLRSVAAGSERKKKRTDGYRHLHSRFDTALIDAYGVARPGSYLSKEAAWHRKRDRVNIQHLAWAAIVTVDREESLGSWMRCWLASDLPVACTGAAQRDVSAQARVEARLAWFARELNWLWRRARRLSEAMLFVPRRQPPRPGLRSNGACSTATTRCPCSRGAGSSGRRLGSTASP